MSTVPNDILLDLAHTHNDIIEHLPHENSLLRVHHLVEGIFQVSVNLEIAQVESPVVLEPLIVISFVCDLSYANCTPF
jgi:hypothetical protein